MAPNTMVNPAAHWVFERVTRSFTVKRGGEQTLRITLVGKPAVYQVRIKPDDARLSVNG